MGNGEFRQFILLKKIVSGHPSSEQHLGISLFDGDL
jgi:hypothetical protein